MKHFIYLILVFGILLHTSSCKTNQTKNHERVGRWYEKMRNGDQIQTIKSKYNSKGIGKGVWYYRMDGKLYKRESHFKDGTCFVTTYHPDGSTESIGQTKLDSAISNLHWYYTGDWFFFDTKGKLIKVKNYKYGELNRETFIK